MLSHLRGLQIRRIIMSLDAKGGSHALCILCTLAYLLKILSKNLI
jgi:hypothetical protein